MRWEFLMMKNEGKNPNTYEQPIEISVKLDQA